MEILEFVLSLTVGGFAGWAATKLFKTDGQNNILMYVVIGAVGAALGNMLIKALGLGVTGSGVITDFVVAFFGATVLVGASKIIAGKLLK